MKDMTAKEVESLIKEKRLNIIDVREVKEVATGKIPRAVNIPLEYIESRLNELDKSKKYIIVCRSGNRSSHAATILKNLGYNAVNMLGGMLAWMVRLNK